MGLSNSKPKCQQPPPSIDYIKFDEICSRGNIQEVASYMRSTGADVRHAYNRPFICACVNDRQELANWMYYDLLKCRINLHINNDSMFKHIVLNAPLRIIKWFMTLDNFNYRANRDDLFHKLCFNNKVDIAMYFESLCDDYRIETAPKDNITISINDEEDDLQDDQLKIINYHVIRGYPTEEEVIKKLDIMVMKKKPTVNVLNTECPICFEEFGLSFPIILPCRHVVCMNCFFQWYYQKRNYSMCILCKQKFYYADCRYVKDINLLIPLPEPPLDTP